MRATAGLRLAGWIVALTGMGATGVAQSSRPDAGSGYYAVNASSSTDIVAQINALTATCGADCVIHVPAGKFRTQSAVPIVLHAGQSLVGEGEQLTSISGNLPKLIVWHASNNAEFFPPAGRIADLGLHCGPATVQCIDMGDLTQAHLEKLLVDGAVDGDCIAITNTNHWFERSSFIDLTVGSAGGAAAKCGVGIHLRPPAGGTNSYGYAYWPSIFQNSSGSGVLVDGGDLLYNASYLGIQSNQDGGTALQVAGTVSAAYLSVTGEGAGVGIHVLKGGSVRGCGSQVSQLRQYVVDGPNDDTHMPLDLTDCGYGSMATVFPNFLGEGKAMLTPHIVHHSSTGEVNAGLFFTDNWDRMGGPAMMFTTGAHYSIGVKDLYNVIGTYRPVWWIDAGGSSVQAGAVTGTNVKSGENVVPYAAAMVFSVAAQMNTVTLAGNGSFTMAAGAPGQAMTLMFCQGGRGGATVTAPANVRGMGTVGGVATRCSVQGFVYSGSRGAWMAAGGMVANE